MRVISFRTGHFEALRTVEFCEVLYAFMKDDQLLYRTFYNIFEAYRRCDDLY